MCWCDKKNLDQDRNIDTFQNIKLYRNQHVPFWNEKSRLKDRSLYRGTTRKCQFYYELLVFSCHHCYSLEFCVCYSCKMDLLVSSQIMKLCIDVLETVCFAASLAFSNVEFAHFLCCRNWLICMRLSVQLNSTHILVNQIRTWWKYRVQLTMIRISLPSTIS